MQPVFLSRTLKWSLRALLWITAIVSILSLTGMLYQTAAAEADRKRFPPPGNLIDVGGFKLHIHCSGEGSPTVILESLSGGTSSYWGWVQPEVAKETRVCVYDRAGRGWSEADPEPQSLSRTARNLYTLLDHANIPGPYVMVGHSIGGLYVREFTARYPGQVKGMVLVDSAHPAQFDRFPELFQENESYMQMAKYFPVLAKLGAWHLYFALGGEIDFAEMKEPQKSEIKAAWSSPDYFRSQYAEMLAGPGLYEESKHLGDLADLPLTVITRESGAPAAWIELQNELASLSTDSLHMTVEQATHASLAFHPEHARAVSHAILLVVKAVRTGQPLGAAPAPTGLSGIAACGCIHE